METITTEQQHAIIGKVISEKRAAEQRLAVLKEEIRRIGDALGTLSGYCRGNAEYIWFTGESTNENYPHPRGDSFSIPDVDGKRLAKLTSELRDVKDEIRSLTRSARQLGF
jgi:hypothetical protein